MKTIFEIARMVEAAIKPNPRDSFIEAGSKRQLMSECQKLIDVEEKYLNAKNVLYNEELSQYLDMDTARSIFYIIDIIDEIHEEKIKNQHEENEHAAIMHILTGEPK